MITEEDLQEAIAECLGQRNPNASTCIKLAAFYVIRNELFNKTASEPPILPVYSGASPYEQTSDNVNIDSDTEFARAINGMESHKAWDIIDDLMSTIYVLNPRLYANVIREIEEG